MNRISAKVYYDYKLYSRQVNGKNKFLFGFETLQNKNPVFPKLKEVNNGRAI